MINMTLIESLSQPFMILMPVRLSRTGFFSGNFWSLKLLVQKQLFMSSIQRLQITIILCVLLCVFYFNESFRLNQSRRCANRNFNLISSHRNLFMYYGSRKVEKT